MQRGLLSVEYNVQRACLLLRALVLVRVRRGSTAVESHEPCTGTPVLLTGRAPSQLLLKQQAEDSHLQHGPEQQSNSGKIDVGVQCDTGTGEGLASVAQLANGTAL